MKRLISISGCGHGGTTLMATILGTHKNLYLYPYETWAFVQDLSDSYNPEIVDNLLNKEYDKEVIGIIEKTPKHIHFVKEIKNRYQDVSFIFMVRDPRDIVASVFKRAEEDFDGSINRVYQDLYSVRLYKHLGLVVRYEDLINDFNKTMLNVCNHINIEYTDDFKDFYKTAPNWFGVNSPENSDGIGDNHNTRRAWQVKQPLFNGSGRWKAELTMEQQIKIYETLGALAMDFGYDISCK